MDLQGYLTKLRGLASALSPAQLVSLAVSFLLVVGIIGGSAMWLNTPTYTLLFADMDQETAGQMVSKLKSLKVDYKLDDGGRAIRVASTKVDELRLELTSQGMPSSGRIGFEIFDRTTFGTTEFVEQVNFRRALEGEIARTISTISSVSSARVHIAPGKEPLFGEKQPSTASVVLKLKDSRGLPPSTAAGIANLVAASVEGLRPESVVILDSGGHPLTTGQGADDQLGSAQIERQQRLERDMSTRVIALLEPVVGEGRVRVNVAMKLNPATLEQTQEKWDPETVIRSRQTQTDTSSQPGGNGGLAGARANLPAATPAPAAVQTAGAGSAHQTDVTNYEVSRTTTRTIQPPGDVARMSVAVILDDAHESKADKDGKQTVKRVPRKPEEMQKLQALVSTAAGLDESRGDRVTVQNIAFDDPLPTDPEAPGFLVRYERPLLEGGRTLVALVIGIVGLLFLKSMFSKSMALVKSEAAARAARPAAIPAGDTPRTVAELESEMDALDVGAGRRLPALTRSVAGLAQKEPATTAKVIRGWMVEGA